MTTTLENQYNSEIAHQNALELTKNMSLENSIFTLTRKLEGIYEDLCNLKDFEETITLTMQDIETAEIRAENISTLNMNLFNKSLTKNERAECALTISMIYLAISKVLENQENSTMAWAALSKAERHMGYIEGLIDFLSQAKKQRSRNANQKKKDYKKQIHDKTIELLHKNKPLKNWSSPIKAVDSIIEELIDFISTENLPFSMGRDSLIHKLLNDIIENPEIKSAYNQNTKIL